MKRYFIILLMLCLLFRQEHTIYATGIAEIEDFNNLEGDEKYLGDNYRDNYSLDIEKTGVLEFGEKMLNNIANVFFSVLRVFAHLVCSIFYFSFDFDITDILGNQIDSIQSALKSSIFNPLFILAFVGVAIILIKRMLKQDIAGILSEMGKVIAIVLLSIFVVNNSSTALSYTTKITKSVCVDILTEMNSSMGVSGGSGTSYAAKASGVLWVNLIHLPWISLEFGNTSPDAETIEKFLSSKAGSDERKELVKGFDDGTFDKEKGAARIGLIVVYSIPFFIKAAIYIIIAMLNLVFQLLALFFVLAAPIILLLAMIPGFENIIGTWLKKILETQISILILTILMALLIKLDTACYSLIPQYGWFVGIIFQTALGLGLFFGRNKILHAFTNMQRGVANPGRMQMQMKHMGNPYKTIENMQRQIKVSQIKSQKDRAIEERVEKVQFTMPDKENKTKTTDNKSSTKKIRPKTQVSPSKNSSITSYKVESASVPDYVATPNQYNQIDTSNLHEIWENAVPKSEIKQSEQERVDNKKNPRQSSVSVSNRPKTNSSKMNTLVEKMEVDKLNSTDGKRKIERPVTWSDDGEPGSTAFINSQESSINREDLSSKRPSTVEQSKNVAGNTPQQLEKKEIHSYNEVPDRPILLNGEPIERNRPTTGKKKYYSNEELKKMSTKKIKEVAMDKAYEYYSSENCHINLGNTSPKEAVNSLMAQKRSKTSMIKDIMAMQKIQANEEVERAVGVEKNLQAPQKRPSTASENSKSGKKISKEKKNRKKSSTDVSKKPVRAKNQVKIKM